MVEKKKLKICFASSSGGHLEEISRLRDLAKNNDSIVLTERSKHFSVDWCQRVFYVSQINRKELLFLPKFIGIFFKSYSVLRKEKPDVIISTGALASCPICFLGKLLKKKVIYIESFARVDQASLTGKLMYRVADLFIVQWKEMLQIFPDAVFVGSIF